MVFVVWFVHGGRRLSLGRFLSRKSGRLPLSVNALVCIALGVYFEARGERTVGQYAVAQTILERVAHPGYPNDPCAVVRQGPTYIGSNAFPIRNKCQFSFYCDGRSDRPADQVAWKKAMTVAKVAYNGGVKDLTGGATHYHAAYVLPRWAAHYSFQQTARIGKHIYYRLKNPAKASRSLADNR